MLKEPRKLTDEELDLLIPHMLWVFDLYFGLAHASDRDFLNYTHCAEWYRRCIESMNEDPMWKDDKHSGDCQNESHTCMRCFVENCRFEVRDLIERAIKWEEEDEEAAVDDTQATN